jgi:hypothetical protein
MKLDEQERRTIPALQGILNGQGGGGQCRLAWEREIDGTPIGGRFKNTR